MGGIIKLFTIGKQKKALANEQAAAQEQASIAAQQARRETEEAGFQAVSLKDQAAKEQDAIRRRADAGNQAAEFNARQLDTNAEISLTNANINEVISRRRGAREMSTQEAAIAGTGFNADDFEDVVRTSAEESFQDALMIRRDGQLQYLDQTAGASLERARGQDVIAAGEIEAEAVMDAAELNSRSILFTGQTRSMASRAEQIKASALASSAKSRKGLVTINAVADAATDAARIAAMRL